jgi:hypothetical protein
MNGKIGEASVSVDAGQIADLYNALLTIVRQNAAGFPVGHDAIVRARAVLAAASRRRGAKIDWAKERSV